MRVVLSLTAMRAVIISVWGDVMGLRLTVDRYSEELGRYVRAFYGTKLFGYEGAKKSARYLIDDLKVMTEDDYELLYCLPDYDGDIVLSEDQFKTFADLYIDDVKHSKRALAYEEWEQDLTAVANRAGKKHIYWG